MEKERIFNLPNFLTFLRGLGSALIIYLVFANFSKLTILVAFILLALTDGIDGPIARKLNQQTRFGKYLDPVMDRIFMIIVVASLTIKFGIINNELVFKLLPLVMTRELTAMPFFMFARKFDVRVNVSTIGKTMTGLQSVTIPWLLLDFPFAAVLIIATSITGIFSGISYAKDSYEPFKELR